MMLVNHKFNINVYLGAEGGLRQRGKKNINGLKSSELKFSNEISL